MLEWNRAAGQLYRSTAFLIGQMTVEVNVIKEIHPGVFWSLLEYPTSRMLSSILDDSYRYVWCHNHIVGDYTWKTFSLPLFSDNVAHEVRSRIVRFDFITSTEAFRRILPQLEAGIHVIQLNQLPPDYFDLDQIHGKTKYDLLWQCDWLFEFDVPGNDYGQIATPNKHFLSGLLQTLGREAHNVG
jgi:hypothetical protein